MKMNPERVALLLVGGLLLTAAATGISTRQTLTGPAVASPNASNTNTEGAAFSHARSDHTHACTAANATQVGCVDTGAQTFAGAKTFSPPIAADSGGTGQSSYAVGDLLYASGAAALSPLAAGSSGRVLASGGAGAAPAWQAAVFARANGTTGTSVNSGVATVVDYNNVNTDSDSAITTGVAWHFTTPAAKNGLYLVVARAEFAATFAGLITLDLYQNGSISKRMATCDAAVSAGCGGVTVGNFAAADSVDVRVTQNSGVAKALTTSAVGVPNYVFMHRFFGQ